MFDIKLVQFLLYALKGTIRGVCQKLLQKERFSNQMNTGCNLALLFSKKCIDVT